MKFDLAIIDLDPLVYRCGFAVEKYDKEEDILTIEPVTHAYYNVNSMMRKILNATGADRHVGYLTSNDKSNFRFELFPEYKANRKDARKPRYYNELREFMARNWGAIVISGEEADDACSIDQYKINTLGFDPEVTNSIVCSFDKDFNNIPGWHYNFVKNEVYYVTEIEALRHFYLQILTGDSADGIPRIKAKWRKKEAEERILSAETEKELFFITKDEIEKIEDFTDEDINAIIRNRGRLVHLRRYPDEMWEIPTEEVQDGHS